MTLGLILFDSLLVLVLLFFAIFELQDWRRRVHRRKTEEFAAELFERHRKDD
jgi:hypothetical protein